MTLPHVQLGNTESDIGQGANTFVTGLLAQRQRQRQIAMQEALAESTKAFQGAQATHLGAQSDLMHTQGGLYEAQTRDTGAQAAQREYDATPADITDVHRLRVIPSYEHVPDDIFEGSTKGFAKDFIDKAMQAEASKQRMSAMNSNFWNRGMPSTDENGNVVIIRPNQPYGGGAEPVSGAGKPLSVAERKMSGGWQAAKSANDDMVQLRHEHPELIPEIARAISLPAIGGLSFIPGTGQGLKEALDNFRFSGASPAAQAFLKRMFDFTGNVGPMRYGLRGMQNPRTLVQLWSDFGYGQFGLSNAGLDAADKNRLKAVIQMQETAGPRAATQGQELFDQTPSAPLVPPQNKYTK